jgi:hypothetical protein
LVPSSAAWVRAGEPEIPGAETSRGRPERLSERQVLISVAHHRGDENSAQEAMAAEWANAESLEQLVREHDSLLALASSDRWAKALAGAGFSANAMAAVRRSPEWDGLVRVLASSEDLALPVTAALSRLATLVTEQADPAAFLRTTFSQWETRADSPMPRPREMIAGLVMKAPPIEDEDLSRAIREREELIAWRARELAEEAVQSESS